MGDPLEEAAETLANARRLRLLRLAPHPLALAALDAARRPLGYRLIDAAAAKQPAVEREPDHALLAAMSELLALAGPGELRLAAGFDPADPEVVWLCPYDRSRITPARGLEIAADVLRHRARTARRSFGVGITRWKRPTVAGFLAGPNGAPVFAGSAAEAARGAARGHGRVVAWASRRTDAAEAAARAVGAPFARLEDGFLRSVGLGSAFVAALSLVLDESGVYYDPSAPSDLETLLRKADIPAGTIARAARLRARLVAEEVTKYNVGVESHRVVPEGRFGVLVPGQVEDDASIVKGAGAVRTNLGLLQAARARRPDAFLIYKPHPDVVAGYRVGAVAERDLAGLADAVVTDGSIAALYPQCRAVETMTSLSGFEALLRGLEVTTHGQPFYAGWSLTEDLARHPRRARARSLDELVAATLILYPLYRDPGSGLPCGPERALDVIARRRAVAATPAGRRAAKLRHLYAMTRHVVLGPIGRWLR
ncbi:beta-3-deoxy-D-manno-oct-2-ulosonic acid transferase [Methylopila sp. 73B]|uniref:capsular polysaccharide export protein, LipB/KpsS family n=1 Tax=Methylopila sp. 73B TaxID=1120792 RepID=UPI001FD8D300|nr:beta-3-deoxy-D-manno-oct-2-ulosonic acid transferase [Methylopila sp. 73B]